MLLSHDHYDHLDKAAIQALAGKVEVFLAPLGVGDRMIEWGVPKDKIRQFDWWQGTEVAGVRLTFTPAQHFSGRGLRDGNRTLWGSWVIIDGDKRVFFSGDSGYFKGFAEPEGGRDVRGEHEYGRGIAPLLPDEGSDGIGRVIHTFHSC